MSSQRSRGWCFTINNYTEDDQFAAHAVCEDSQYGIVGYEVGEEGTHHLQCYVHYKDACSFKTMKSRLPRAHIEKARGTPSQNRKYCSKEENFCEYGDIPKDTTPVTESVMNMIEGRQLGIGDPRGISRFLLPSSEEDSDTAIDEISDEYDFIQFS